MRGAWRSGRRATWCDGDIALPARSPPLSFALLIVYFFLMAVVLLSLQPRAFASQPSFEISLGFKMSRSIVCTGQENLCCPTCCVIEFQKEPDSLKANLFPPPSSFFFPSYFDSKAITICNNNHVPGAGKLVFRSDATARADVLPTVSAADGKVLKIRASNAASIRTVVVVGLRSIGSVNEIRRERDGRSEREGGEGVVLLMRLLHAPAASLKERSRPYRFALLTAKATGRPPARLLRSPS